MLHPNNQFNVLQGEHYHLHQMAVAGDVLEDFVVIFRDMMNRVCNYTKLWEYICALRKNINVYKN